MCRHVIDQISAHFLNICSHSHRRGLTIVFGEKTLLNNAYLHLVPGHRYMLHGVSLCSNSESRIQFMQLCADERMWQNHIIATYCNEKN